MTVLACGVLFGARDLGDLVNMRDSGLVLTARITNKSIVEGKSTTFSWTYEYTVGHDHFEWREPISASTYAETNVGDPLTVSVLRDKPWTHRVGRIDQSRVDEQTFHWGLGTLVVSGLLALGWGVLEVRIAQERRLLSRWELVPATIEKVRIPGGEEGFKPEVIYRFEFRGKTYRRVHPVSIPNGPGVEVDGTLPCLVPAHQPETARLLATLSFAVVVPEPSTCAEATKRA